MAITFPASPSDGDVFTNATTGVKYIYNAADGVWKTHVWPTNTNYLQLSGGTLTGDLSLGTNDLTAQDINSTTLTTTGGVTVGNGLTVSDGNVVMASGHGIDFSATANGSGTTTSELLDDYEKGTWTPNWTFNGNNVGLTYELQAGTYTKIGQQVFCYGAFNLTNKGTSTGSVLITGLPFTASDQVAGTGIEGGIISAYQANFTGTHVGPLIGGVINNQSYFDLYRVSSTNPGESVPVTDGNVTNTTYFRFTVIYTTAS
jgi:hypothetical protein